MNSSVLSNPKAQKANKLSPLPTSKSMRKRQRKIYREKENNWVLDCVNEKKSKLKPYSSLRDKYLKYFVIGVPKKKRNHCANSSMLNHEYSSDNKIKNNSEIPSENDFKQFLASQKERILNQKNDANKQDTH